MQAGLLKEFIEIYAPQISTNEYNEQVVEYVKIYETKANVKFVSGSKGEQNNETFYSKSRKFIVRSYVPIKDNYRIKYDNNFYSIVNWDKDNYYNNITINGERVNE